MIYDVLFSMLCTFFKGLFLNPYTFFKGLFVLLCIDKFPISFPSFSLHFRIINRKFWDLLGTFIGLPSDSVENFIERIQDFHLTLF